MPNNVPSNVSSNIIFGGELGWKADEWIDSDDRVRGGKSQSYLSIYEMHAVFKGHLDVDTLGGAGFASQRTQGDDRHWDLSEFKGIQITFDPSNTDDKTYAFILKDELLPQDPDTGREQSSVSWEYEFSIKTATVCNAKPGLRIVTIPWNAFKPTYRGRPKADAKPLEKADIRRMSIMMRSYFGAQKGDFTLDLYSINGTVGDHKLNTRIPNSITESDDQSSITSYDKSADHVGGSETPNLLSRIFCCGLKL